MKNLFKIMVLIIGILFISFQFALARDPIPEGLDEIFEEMSDLEESYEEGQWQDARESVEEVHKNMNEFLAKSQGSNLAQDKKLLSMDLHYLRASIDEKNMEKTETNYIKLQKRLFDFLNNFEYEIHPIFSIIDKYLNEEATEAVAENDYDDVIAEMREVFNLIKLAYPLLKDKGYSEEEYKDFRLKIFTVIKAGKQSDGNLVNEKLKEVKEEYKSIMVLVK